MSHAANFDAVPLADVFAKGITAQSGPCNPVVLVVDDEVVIADTLTTILAQHGIAAMAAYDGPGALEIARLIPPDLLLADVVMPGMSGIDLAITIQKDVPDCSILLFSGQAATKGLLAKAGKAWCDFEVILKPIHPEKLVNLIFERLNVSTVKQPCAVKRRPQDTLQSRLVI
ncbi:MAG: response regulator [Acidobacteriaceae bacterium]